MRTLQDLSEVERRVLSELRSRISAELSGQAVRMTLFGSRARGDGEPDSDMDVLLEVDTEHVTSDDKKKIRRVAGEVSMDSGIIVTLFVVDRHVMKERGDFSIFENIREEGIPV